MARSYVPERDDDLAAIQPAGKTRTGRSQAGFGVIDGGIQQENGINAVLPDDQQNKGLPVRSGVS